MAVNRRVPPVLSLAAQFDLILFDLIFFFPFFLQNNTIEQMPITSSYGVEIEIRKKRRKAGNTVNTVNSLK